MSNVIVAPETPETPVLSAVTLRSYANSLKRLQRAELDLTDYNAVCAWIDGLEKGLETKKLYYNALAHNFKYTDAPLADRYKSRMRPLARVLFHESRSQRLTDTEREKYLPYDEIQDVFNYAILDPDISKQDAMLLGFYTQIPPVRSDYSRLRVYYNQHVETAENCIEIWGNARWCPNATTMTVHIAEHKTASTSGTLKREIPLRLREVICDYLKGRAVVSNMRLEDYLATEIYLFDFPPAEITVRLQRVFQRYTGKAISVNIIRHAYITKQTEGRPALAQLEEEAAEMGHSVLTHEKYRRLDA